MLSGHNPTKAKESATAEKDVIELFRDTLKRGIVPCREARANALAAQL
jgi:hypothetical protein